MGRTCGEPNEIKTNTHPENITIVFRLAMLDARRAGAGGDKFGDLTNAESISDINTAYVKSGSTKAIYLDFVAFATRHAPRATRLSPHATRHTPHTTHHAFVAPLWHPYGAKGTEST